MCINKFYHLYATPGLNHISFRTQGHNKSLWTEGQRKSSMPDGNFRVVSIFKMSRLYKKLYKSSISHGFGSRAVATEITLFFQEGLKNYFQCGLNLRSTIQVILEIKKREMEEKFSILAVI